MNTKRKHIEVYATIEKTKYNRTTLKWIGVVHLAPPSNRVLCIGPKFETIAEVAEWLSYEFGLKLQETDAAILDGHRSAAKEA